MVFRVAPVDYVELIVGGLLVLLLLGLGGYYAWRQIRLFGILKRDNPYPPAERIYLRRQARRRLVGSALLVAFAGLLVGSYFLDPGSPDTAAVEQGAEPSPEQTRLLWLFVSYWAAALLLFLAIICLALIDLLATRRFTLRQLRHLHDQQEALFAEQAARFRSERNGPRN
jgi:hypothetical protein